MNSHKTTKFVSFLARKFPAIQYKSDVLNPESICNQSGVLSSLDRWQLLTAISSPLFVKIVSMLLCYVVMYIHSTCRPSNLPQRKQPCINCAMWFNRTSVPSDPSKNMNAAEDFLLLLSHTRGCSKKSSVCQYWFQFQILPVQLPSTLCVCHKPPHHKHQLRVKTVFICMQLNSWLLVCYGTDFMM